MVNGGGSVTGNVTLSSGGQLLVGQNMTTLSVGSDLQTSGGGQVKVGGNLGSLMVTGAIQGKGSEDVEVGDDLGQLMVVGGGNGFGLTRCRHRRERQHPGPRHSEWGYQGPSNADRGFHRLLKYLMFA